MSIGASLVDPLIKTLVTALASFIIKYVTEKYSGNKVFEKKKKLSDLKDLLFGLEKQHPAIIEEEVSLYLGSKFRCSEILLIMSLQNPMHTFGLLKKGRTFLNFDEDGKTYTAKESIATENSENRRRNIYGILYSICSFLALFPLVYSPELIGDFGAPALVSILFWSVFMLLLGLSFLEEGSRIYLAKKALEQLKYRRNVT